MKSLQRTALLRAADWLRAEYGLLRHPYTVISFPKSGRTWLKVMFDELGIDARFSHAFAQTAGHLLSDIDGKEHRRSELTLVLIRDPKDTVVSYFHACTRRGGLHEQMRHLYPSTLSAFIRDPRFGVEKIARFNLFWCAVAAGTEGMSVLTYEALHAHTAQMLAEAGRHFGHAPSPEDVARAVEAGSFQTMRSREASGAYRQRYGRQLSPGRPDDPDSFKVRKGRVGGYTEEMTTADIEWCNDMAYRLGYRERLADLLNATALPRTHETQRAEFGTPAHAIGA